MTPILLKAAQGEKTPRPPIWMMRQAGRFLPEYRAIRERSDTLTMFRTPSVAAEITLQPLQRFPMDGAIVYADILLIPNALGQKLTFVQGEGPLFGHAIREADDVREIRRRWEERSREVMGALEHVGETLERVKPALAQEQTLIGFAGAPWTVACYMIEARGTQGEFFEAKKFAARNPELLHELLELVTEVTIEYLKMQISAGAQVIQLFESWGLSLSARDFRSTCLPYVQKIIRALPSEIPVVYFVNGVGSLLDDAAQSGAQVLGLDWRVDLESVVGRLDELRRGPGGEDFGELFPKTLQGNLDPVLLFAEKAQVVGETQRLLEVMRASPFAHIFNLGHGLKPTTPVEAVGWVVDTVRGSTH